MCRGPDKASVMITTGWRRPGVPTPRVLNGSLGNLIGGNSRRFLCAHSEGKEAFADFNGEMRLSPGLSQARWNDTQGTATKLPLLSGPAGPGSGFNRDKGAPLGQRLAVCFPVASIRVRGC